MPREFVMAVLAGLALAAAAPVLSHEEDEDEDDWREYRRDYEREKRRHRDRHLRYFYYERPPIVMDRQPPRPPRRHPEPVLKTPRDFPKESRADHAAAKERQRDILEKELAAEQALLAKAKKELAERSARLAMNGEKGEASEKLRAYKDGVETHEKNIGALKRELNNLER